MAPSVRPPAVLITCVALVLRLKWRAGSTIGLASLQVTNVVINVSEATVLLRDSDMTH